MVSVVIPLYNNETYVVRALASVMAQTYSDFEIIVVDDGSTDNGARVIEDLQIPCLRLVRQNNAGVSIARNRGIREAKGDLIAFLDADDEWKPEYLETQMRLVKKFPQCDIFAVNYEFQNRQGDTAPTIIRKLLIEGINGELTNYFEIASCSHPPLWTSAVLVRLTAIQSVGGFPVGIKSGEDLLTWAKLVVNYRLAYSSIPLAIYHVDDFGIKEKPKRIPEECDVVGNELLIIAQKYHPKHIKSYISHWHKMRSSVYLRLGMRKKSIYEACYGLKYNMTNYKLYIYIFLNLIPKGLRPF